MGKGLIILMAALLLALTLACEMAGGIGNALQDEPGTAEGVSTAPAPTASLQQVPAETAASASDPVPAPANVPTPDPTIAAAIASLNDIGNCRKLEERMRHIESRWPYLPKKSLRDLEWVDAGTIIQDFIRDETRPDKIGATAVFEFASRIGRTIEESVLSAPFRGVTSMECGPCIPVSDRQCWKPAAVVMVVHKIYCVEAMAFAVSLTGSLRRATNCPC